MKRKVKKECSLTKKHFCDYFEILVAVQVPTSTLKSGNMSDVEVTQSDDTVLSAEPMDGDSDDLDDLLGMLDEEEEVEQKEKAIEAKKS